MESIKKFAPHIERQIIRQYRSLLRICKPEYDKEGIALIRKAYYLILDKSSDQDEKWGEHVVAHAVQLARIAASELGLDAVSVAAALLFEFVNLTGVPPKELKQVMGDKIDLIIRELLKINQFSGVPDKNQGDHMLNLILTLSSDYRVILIKLADRLYTMRQIGQVPEEQQIALACEAKYLYSALAHRLGLYNMMSEMEDISMSILEKEAYAGISEKLTESTAQRNRFIQRFIKPIREGLENEGFVFEIKGRTKAISSIWRKMRQQNVDFEEVYDKFAIRIILESPPKKEKEYCWRAYSIVTDFYQPNPERLRDWISVPKSNGYESLHTTVIIPGGEWVEVQIRTRRMNEIAEKGLAAHWKYKGIEGQDRIDQWLSMVREMLETNKEEAGTLIDELKLAQYSKEIFVFTPNGELKKFPEKATVLDFAFDIHTAVGASCVGARVNGKNVPIRYQMKNGDKVEILRSKTQKPKLDWINFAVTSKAKGKIKQALKEEKLKEAENGKEILKRRLKNWKIDYDDTNIRKILRHYKLKDAIDLYFDIATEKIDLLEIKILLSAEEEEHEYRTTPIDEQAVSKIIRQAVDSSNDFLLIDERLSNVEYRFAKCCNPIQGDDIFGFVTIGSGITIHRMNCPNAHEMISRFGYRVVRARWTRTEKEAFFTVALRVTGVDDIGIVSSISDVISKDLQVNMRSISIDSNDGMFDGTITLMVKNTQHLEAMIRKLKKVRGVINVRRVDTGS
ncbi:MAG: RelA/SpoT family protein [Bacteroidota bacterium]